MSYLNVLVAMTMLSAQPAAEPAYVIRGRQTEVKQRDYHSRLERFQRGLANALRVVAPDLEMEAAPPPPDVFGYQVVPALGTDRPSAPPGTKSTVSSFGWAWSETLISRQLAAIDHAESELAQLALTAESRPALVKLLATYRKLVGDRHSIDYDIKYNWDWQAQIFSRRPVFDGLQKIQQQVLTREAIDAALATSDAAVLALAAEQGLGGLTPDQARAALRDRSQSITSEVRAANGWAGQRDFLRIERAGNSWTLTVPVCTDIADPGSRDAFRRAIEGHWQGHVVKDGQALDYRVAIDLRPISTRQLYCGKSDEPRCHLPADGEHLNLNDHVAKFPPGAVLTTGAPNTKLYEDRAIALGPYEISPRVLAHEFGHVIGFPDAYYRGYRDAGADGFIVTELADMSDIMGAPGFGPVLPRHFDVLIASRARALLNESLQQCQAQRYTECLETARSSVSIKPDYAEAHNNMAAALAGLKRWDEAITAAKEAIRLKPDFQLAKANLAWATREKADLKTTKK